MILLIDNYDSFVYNIYQYLGELGASVSIFRNDKISVDEIVSMHPEKIIISPGPCTPSESGLSVEIIRAFGANTPLLGVCLGHQCIGAAYGGRIIKMDRVWHGKTSEIHHNGENVFKNIPDPFVATRYHSLVLEKETCPDALEVTAWTDDGTIMGLRHKTYPVYGVQFHPESILTNEGKKILQNFIDL